jgi:signal transduction histidine kinase
MTKAILVIDDDVNIRETIQDFLESEGFQAIVADSGKKGVELAIEKQPDLILCDIQMPEMDGYSVLEALQDHALTATIPFIFLTAKIAQFDIRHGMTLGADDYLTKPCQPEELLKAINSRLQKRRILQSHTQEQLEQLRQSIALSLPHEFCTPLSGIFTTVELLRLSAGDPEKVLELADILQTSTERLYRLVQQFLDYAKLELLMRDPEQQQEILHGETSSSYALIERIAQKIAQRAERAADLQLDLQDFAIAVPLPEAQKIFQELIDNAFKFSESGTPVSVTSMLTPSYGLVEIINYGRGMTAEQIANLGAYQQFERRFYEQQGTGLGLAIVQRLLKLYKGDLAIASIPGQQTTVKVLLPLG